MKKKSDLAKLANRCLRAKEAGKRGYERSDRLLVEIASELEVGAEIVIAENGKKVVLVDRFADKDIVWQPCAARRWELKVINE